MGARKHETNQERFTSRQDVMQLNEGTTLVDLLTVAAAVVQKSSHSAVIQKNGIDWKYYKPIIQDGVGYIVRETCERCGKVHLPPGQRKLRCIQTDIGPVYMDTGICKDCINASIYVDKYLDGDPLSEAEAKKLYYKYAEAYEKQWRIVLSIAPRIAMTKEEWDHRCRFFGGCAMCGGYIEVQHKYFPSSLNGEYTPWNIIPLCGACAKQYRQVGKRSQPEKAPRKYKVFSSPSYFQKTKTIRLFLLAQMEFHGIYMDNLTEFRQRFFEKKILPHSLPTTIKNQQIEAACIDLSRQSARPFMDIQESVMHLYAAGFPEEDIFEALKSTETLDSTRLLAISICATQQGEH